MRYWKLTLFRSIEFSQYFSCLSNNIYYCNSNSHDHNIFWDLTFLNITFSFPILWKLRLTLGVTWCLNQEYLTKSSYLFQKINHKVCLLRYKVELLKYKVFNQITGFQQHLDLTVEKLSLHSKNHTAMCAHMY